MYKMSRISNSSFKVNSNLEQQIELAAVAGGVTVPISSGATLDVDVVANTAALATAANQTSLLSGQSTTNSTLSNIDSNTTGLATQSTLASVLTDTNTIAADTTSLDSKITQGSNGTLASAQQVGLYAHDASNFVRLACTAAGALNVNSAGADHSGSQGNLSNAASVSSGSFSTAIDTSNSTLLTIFGSTTGSDQITIQVSANGTNYYPIDFEIYPQSGNFYQTLNGICANNVRLKYNGTATVTATLLQNIH